MCDHSLKNLVFIILVVVVVVVVVVVCTFCWTNIYAAMSVAGFHNIKWLSEQFWRCCPCVYVLIETSRAIQCVCAKVKHASHKLYYQRMWAEHSGEQISEGDQLYHSTAALLQTGTSTSILTLHRHFLSVRYLSGLSSSGEHDDREKHWMERHVAQWWRLM